MSPFEVSRNSEWIGCIDFGTAMSKVALARRRPRMQLQDADIVPLAIGDPDRKSAGNPLLLPSVVFITKDGLLFGQEALSAALRGERLRRQPFSSPKQYLSTHDLEELDEPLEMDIDPTGSYTARDLLVLFLAHLLVRADRAATVAAVPWPVPLRIARPAWAAERAVAGEATLQAMVLRAFAIAGELAGELMVPKGINHSLARWWLSKVTADKSFDDPFAFAHVFEPSPSGNASVLEATAVAAGSIRDTGRRVVAIADIGGGTADFGAFMTGLPGHDVLAEIQGSSRILREAGDYLDMLLTNHVLRKAGIDPLASAGRGAANRLRMRQRANKEVLFSDGEVTIELGDDIRMVNQKEFLSDPHVQDFSERLRSKFHETLRAAVKCARQHPQPDGRPTQVEILLTGGGHGLPMVKELMTKPSVPWNYVAASPELVAKDPDLEVVHRQLAVAIGGAVRDLPRETAVVRVSTSCSSGLH